MELSINIIPKKGYLHITAQGEYSLQRAMDLFIDALDAACRHRLCKILVDYRGVFGIQTDMEKFQYAKFGASRLSELCSQGDVGTLRLAYVGSEPFFDISRFGETVAVNRGAIAIDTTSMEEAIEFLGIDEPDVPQVDEKVWT